MLNFIIIANSLNANSKTTELFHEFCKSKNSSFSNTVWQQQQLVQQLQVIRLQQQQQQLGKSCQQLELQQLLYNSCSSTTYNSSSKDVSS
jgi:hypothetical protein